jgi:tetratricopeptide (TPR) repeat protein
MSGEELYQLAYRLENDGNIPEALETYNKLIEQFPDSTRVGSAKLRIEALSEKLEGEKMRTIGEKSPEAVKPPILNRFDKGLAIALFIFGVLLFAAGLFSVVGGLKVEIENPLLVIPLGLLGYAILRNTYVAWKLSNWVQFSGSLE